MILDMLSHVPAHIWFVFIVCAVIVMFTLALMEQMATRPLTMVLSFIPVWFWVLAIGVIGCFSYTLFQRETWYHEGYTAAITDIQAANEKELNDANTAQKPVDACFASGGDWNRERGVCEHPANK